MRDQQAVVHVLIISVLVLAAAFHHPWPRNRVSQSTAVSHRSKTPLKGSLWTWLEDRLQQPLAAPRPSQTLQETTNKPAKTATVIRTAARTFQGAASRPSSRDYTTRKDSRVSVQVSAEGVQGDYNHYRTTALKSTPDRAISIVTYDVMNILRSKYSSSQDGDLGENILIDGLTFRDLKIGQQYEFSNTQSSVLVEITEPVTPCANLCKLPYINDPKLEPKQRIFRCQELIEFLEKADGFRGWYAKVLQPGKVHVGDEFRVALVA